MCRWTLRRRGAIVPLVLTRVREIDADQQYQQIPTRDRHHARRLVGGPREGAVLQALVEHPEARMIPDQDLHAVAAPIAEDGQLPREGIGGEARADDLRHGRDWDTRW